MKIILIMGLPGAGKTTLANELAELIEELKQGAHGANIPTIDPNTGKKTGKFVKFQVVENMAKDDRLTTRTHELGHDVLSEIISANPEAFKGIAEQMYVNFAKQQTDVKVALCRYGNVLDSTGSLIPVFKDIVQRGAKSLPITNTDMTRFLITLDEAIDLIEWSYESKDSHGKIVVPELPSMKIIDFAKAIAKSLGKDDIEFHKIPIRSGEKLHEEMISSIEYQRVVRANDKYLMIGYERHNEDYNHTPLNSEFYVMDSDEAYNFLVEKGVL